MHTSTCYKLQYVVSNSSSPAIHILVWYTCDNLLYTMDNFPTGIFSNRNYMFCGKVKGCENKTFMLANRIFNLQYFIHVKSTAAVRNLERNKFFLLRKIFGFKKYLFFCKFLAALVDFAWIKYSKLKIILKQQNKTLAQTIWYRLEKFPTGFVYCIYAAYDRKCRLCRILIIIIITGVYLYA